MKPLKEIVASIRNNLNNLIREKIEEEDKEDSLNNPTVYTKEELQQSTEIIKEDFRNFCEKHQNESSLVRGHYFVQFGPDAPELPFNMFRDNEDVSTTGNNTDIE